MPGAAAQISIWEWAKVGRECGLCSSCAPRVAGIGIRLAESAVQRPLHKLQVVRLMNFWLVVVVDQRFER